jgi:hypothetical protein
MPSTAFCMNCHEDLDKEKDKPAEKKVAWFQDEKGEVRWADYGRQKDEIKFSHAAHAGKASCSAATATWTRTPGFCRTVRSG